MTDSSHGGITRRAALKGGAGALLGLSTLGLAACGSSGSSSGSSAVLKPKPDGDITWFTWNSYVDPKVLKRFEKTYGVQVKQAYFDAPEAMLQKIASGQPYDLITTNSAFNKRMIEGNLLRGFDPSDMKGWDNLEPYFRNPVYDNGQTRYSIPYGYGPAGIAYVKDKVHVTGSWNDLWNNEEAKGHIYILDEEGETLTMSLIRDGASVNSDDPAAVQKAANQLIALKPQLRGISSDVNTIIPSGNAWMMHAWGGTTLQALKTMKPADADKWDFEYPKEGLSMGSDTLSVGAKAKSPGTALLFMQFLLEPENSSANVSFTGYPNGTSAGDAAYKETTKDFPFVYLPSNDPSKFHWRESPTGARLTLWNEQWSKVTA
jgi:spermidine/putrescine transport system substrate-binding protein